MKCSPVIWLTVSLSRFRLFTWTTIWFKPLLLNTQLCWPTTLYMLISVFSGSRLSLAGANVAAPL
jgi:hypothetical protein